ncbi:hypothetical protein Lepto7375DRAFT_1064 [Leptolyngbya sp. PCC 7375]|nr:hypothetical protein Lepto7375DRAFT_1064 [Leptolyngbya sp. PCC 7375]
MKPLTKARRFCFFAIIICFLVQFYSVPNIASSFGTKPVLAQSSEIMISLPNDAEVSLKGIDGSRSGKVIGLDNQHLTLQRSGNTTTISLDRIEQVSYDRNSPFYRSSGEIVMRGSQVSPIGAQDTWRDLPLSDFIFRDTNTGQAGVILDTVLSSTELRGVSAVAQDSTYVVDEMYFDMQQSSITLVLTPY